jgi:hypothetical protein
MENNQELKAPPTADFMQQPYWASDDKVVIKGKDFEILYNFVSSFGPAVDAARKVMDENIKNGVIKMRYVREDGTEVPAAEVEAYHKNFQDYVNKMREAAKAATNGQETPASNPLTVTKNENYSSASAVDPKPASDRAETDQPLDEQANPQYNEGEIANTPYPEGTNPTQEG